MGPVALVMGPRMAPAIGMGPGALGMGPETLRRGWRTLSMGPQYGFQGPQYGSRALAMGPGSSEWLSLGPLVTLQMFQAAIERS